MHVRVICADYNFLHVVLYISPFKLHKNKIILIPQPRNHGNPATNSSSKNFDSLQSFIDGYGLINGRQCTMIQRLTNSKLSLLISFQEKMQ